MPLTAILSEKKIEEKYSHIWDIRRIDYAINLMKDELSQAPILEAKLATLADCFVQMIKLAVITFQLPSSNLDKSEVIQVFNYHYLELQHSTYLFINAAISATTLWKILGYPEE
ncbi:ribonuclease H-like domain-containing protein [Rhizophagus irregularis DAOM 181602=DAOM 197198]|nr:ribonuclease H-like domain-containing protein [Rhizophagus irregularis DAOM 181602=DAOM 197198]CAG8720411.1 11826_t:CDS:2 [Rhizophagus irregularis]